MGMVAILFNGATPFEQTNNTTSTEGHIRNQVKIGGAISEKTFKIMRFSYMYIANGQGQII